MHRSMATAHTQHGSDYISFRKAICVEKIDSIKAIAESKVYLLLWGSSEVI